MVSGMSGHEPVDLDLTGARQETGRDRGINTLTVRECQPQLRDKYFTLTLRLELIGTREHSRRDFDIYNSDHHLQ